MTVRAVSLFAGIGATAKGLRDIVGAEVVAAVELNPVFADTLRRNFGPEVVVEANVAAVDWSQYGPVDIVVGGPPCQPFSQATNGTGEYDERDAIPHFVRAVRELQPQVFVMEEVWTLTWARHRAYLDRVLSDLRAAGYRVDFRVLRMDRYGIPQARKRLFVVGVRDDLDREPQWPEERPSLTMAEALDWGPEEAARRAKMAPVPDPAAAQWVYERPATTVVGSFRPEVQAAPGYRKPGDGPRQNTPGSVVITLEEALVLQGLPRTWQVAGNEAQRRLQVGNSCPPQMTAAIVLAQGVDIPSAHKADSVLSTPRDRGGEE